MSTCNCMNTNCPCRNNQIRFCPTCGVALGYSLEHNHSNKEDLDYKANKLKEVLEKQNVVPNSISK